MLQFQSGSREPFEQLFGRYQQSLYGFFRRRTINDVQAEDLAQETWIGVLQGSLRYKVQAPFRTYLYGIAFKVLAGERRKNKRTQVPLTDSSQASASRESEQWVREALQRLDATEREILMLREYEQLSYAEIAELLHIPINTVRSRLFRARSSLKRSLDPGAETIAAEGRS